jgi:hypothetical protein
MIYKYNEPTQVLFEPLRRTSSENCEIKKRSKKILIALWVGFGTAATVDRWIRGRYGTYYPRQTCHRSGTRNFQTQLQTCMSTRKAHTPF